MIRTLIVDDELEAVRGLQETLRLFCPSVEVAGQAGSVAEAVRKIQTLKPRLVFLDIEMRDGLGFDVLQQLPDRDFITVFVSAFNHYTLRALRMNAMDYLLKPVEPEELIVAVEKARAAAEFPDYSHLLDAYVKGKYTRIGIPDSKGTKFLQLSNIIRMESSNNYTYIFCSDSAKPLLVSRTLKSFEEILPLEDFLRCHQRHIVNLNFIKGIIKAENSFLILDGNFEVPVSRPNKGLVEKAMANRFPSV